MEQLLLQILSEPSVPAWLKLLLLLGAPPAVVCVASVKSTVFFYRTMSRIKSLERKFDNGINAKLESLDGKMDEHGARITALEAACKARHGGHA